MYKITTTESIQYAPTRIDKHRKGGWGEINIVSKYYGVKRK